MEGDQGGGGLESFETIADCCNSIYLPGLIPTVRGMQWLVRARVCTVAIDTPM